MHGWLLYVCTREKRECVCVCTMCVCVHAMHVSLSPPQLLWRAQIPPPGKRSWPEEICPASASASAVPRPTAPRHVPPRRTRGEVNKVSSLPHTVISLQLSALDPLGYMDH